jgi:HlyD family secretion protein
MKRKHLIHTSRLTGRLAGGVIGALLLASCESEPVLTMVGTLERDRIELKVESSEPIISIDVADGQEVSPGDLIARQDPARSQARLAQFEALRQQAAARLAELVRGPREESIRQARAELESSVVIRKNARTNYERDEEVFEKGLSTQAVRDLSETNWKAALAREQANREALEAMLHGTTVEELQQASAAVAAAEAQVSQAALDVERTRIVAPVSGTVDKILFQMGERPPAGTTLTVLLADDRVFARIYVPESERASIRPGDSLDVRIDGVDQTFTGRVRWVSSDASFTPYFALTQHDRSKLSYLAEVDIPEAAALPSGIPLEVSLPAR